MATTTTVKEVDLLKKPSSARREMALYRLRVGVTGTYLTGTKPSFDVLAALEAFGRQAESAVVIPAAGCMLFGDYYDGTNRYTAPNANIALSSTGNKVVTFRVDSGATNGAAGTEIADATALSGEFEFVVAVAQTAAKSL
jgi:hypothetical protein